MRPATYRCLKRARIGLIGSDASTGLITARESGTPR